MFYIYYKIKFVIFFLFLCLIFEFLINKRVISLLWFSVVVRVRVVLELLFVCWFILIMGGNWGDVGEGVGVSGIDDVLRFGGVGGLLLFEFKKGKVDN